MFLHLESLEFLLVYSIQRGNYYKSVSSPDCFIRVYECFNFLTSEVIQMIAEVIVLILICFVGVVPATVSIAMHEMCDLKPSPWTVNKRIN